MSERQKVVLISSGQPSLNPRLVKEADALAGAGYDVLVIYQYWNDWGTKADELLLPTKKWAAIRVGGAPGQQAFSYWLSTNIFRARRLLNKVSKGRLITPRLLIGRCSVGLIREACRHQAALYIAHNLAALPAAINAAKRYNARAGFDAEDFHRNEVSDDESNADVRLKSAVENEFIPRVDYFTASSPGIADAYQKLFPDKHPVVIRNVFPYDETISISAKPAAAKLRLFWFSQTIGPGRGLEDVTAALNLLNNPDIELHLVGFLHPSGRSFLSGIGADTINLHLHQPMSPDKLNSFATLYDVGLALESGFCRNNDLALSNKLFTYMQAGLAVIASDTSAQKAFMQGFPDTGRLYQKGDVYGLAGIITAYYNDRTSLFNARVASREAASHELNWEKESRKFLGLIKEQLTD